MLRPSAGDGPLRRFHAERALELGREGACVSKRPFRIVLVHKLIVGEVNVPSVVHVEHLDEVCRIVLGFGLWADRQLRLLFVENILRSF